MTGCRPGRWWWGLPVLALLWAAACWLTLPGIEAELARCAALQSGPTSLLVMTREGQRLVLRGPLSAEARRTLEAELRRAGFAGEIADAPPAVAAPEIPAPDEGMLAAARALARLAGGEAAIGRDSLALSGRAVDFAAYNAIRDEMRGRPGDKKMVTLDLVPPDASPFVWSVERRENGLDLSGFVPSETVRAEIVAAANAAMPGLAVGDRMQTAGGAPRDLAFADAVRFAFGQLARLSRGTAALRGNGLTIDGASQDRDSLAALQAAMAGLLPAGLAAGEVRLAALPVQPYIFAARRAQGTLTLTGYAPSEEARARILDSARRAFLTEQIVDDLHLGDGASPDFVTGASFALGHLAQLASGQAQISGTALTITGESLYRQGGERSRAQILANAPPGWSSRADIAITTRDRVLDSDLCQDLLTEGAKKEPVRFEPGKSAVTPEAQALLDRLAGLLKRCGTLAATIGIETEAGEGGAALGRTRIEAAIAALARAGIAPERLRAAAPEPEKSKTDAPSPAAAAPAITVLVER